MANVVDDDAASDDFDVSAPASFNPKMYAANLSHVTYAAISRWRRVMAIASDLRTEDDLDHVDHLVRASRFFSKLDETQRKEFYRVATIEVCRKGEWLFKQGDVGNEFYVILFGQVEVVISIGGEGSSFEKAVASLGPLVSFGEKALEDADSLRKAGIRAKEHTELMKIEREGYTSVMESWKRRTAPHKSKFLLNTGLFRGWSKEELFDVATKLNQDMFDPGMRIVEEGGRKDTVDLFFIRVGECDVLVRVPNPSRGGPRSPATQRRGTARQGKRGTQGRPPETAELRVTTLHKYAVFGHEAVLLGAEQPNPHTICSATNVEVYVLKRDDLTAILAGHARGAALREFLDANLRVRMDRAANTFSDRRERREWERFKRSVVAHYIAPSTLQAKARRLSEQGLVSDRLLERRALGVLSPRLRLGLEDAFLSCGYAPKDVRRTAQAAKVLSQAAHVTAEGGPTFGLPSLEEWRGHDGEGGDSDEDYGELREPVLDAGHRAVLLVGAGSSGRGWERAGSSPTARVFGPRYAARSQHRRAKADAQRVRLPRVQGPGALKALAAPHSRRSSAAAGSAAASARRARAPRGKNPPVESPRWSPPPTVGMSSSAPALPPLRVRSGTRDRKPKR